MRILANDVPTNIPGAEQAGGGGTGNLTALLGPHAALQGHVWIGVCYRGTRAKKPFFRKIYDKKRQIFVTYFFPSASATAIVKAPTQGDPREILRPEIEGMKRLMKRMKPDIVFLNGYSLQGWLMLAAAQELQLPLVMKHGGLWKIEIDLYRDLYSPAGRKLLCDMERDISRYADLEIFLNETSREQYKKIIAPLPIQPHAVIPQQLPPLHPRRHAKHKDERVQVGIVARWDRIKNHKAFYAVAKRAHELELPWDFHAVCAFPAHPKRRLGRIYKKYVTVHPPMKKPELFSFYDKMDIALLPSLYDVMPHVVIEAASRGIGTIIAENVGWRSVFEKTKNRIWIDSFTDPDETIRKMKRLKGKNLSPEFFQYAKKHMNKTKVLDRYLETFAQVIKAKKD